MGRTACTKPQCLYKGTLLVHLPHSVLEVHRTETTSALQLEAQLQEEHLPENYHIAGHSTCEEANRGPRQYP